MARFTRQQILDRLNAKIRSGQPIVGGGAPALDCRLNVRRPAAST
jgi:hypothetical protein